MKSIIYSMSTGEIRAIVNSKPEWKDLSDDEDFDSYNSWMSLDDSKEKIRLFESK